MSDIGIGILGSGFMGRTFSETITKFCKGAAVRAVACGSRAEQLAKDYGVDLEASVEGVIGRDDVDAVFIATPHNLHADQAVAAAKAGKHVLIEKPMACSVADCDAILAACDAAGVFSSISFSQRSRKCCRRAKELIDDGAIGRVRQFQSFALVPTGLDGLPSWQSDAANLGTLFGHAIHNFDMLRWFTGQEIRTVYAKCMNFPNADVEGTSMVTMSLTDGTPCHLWSSFDLPKPSFPRSQYAAWIVGEKGLIDLDGYGELRMANDGEWKLIETQEPIDWAGQGFLDPVRLESYTLQCQAFIDAIAAKQTPPVTGWDGRQAVAAALAAYESSKTGKEITLS